ncbi:MAG: hypothetical protein MPJ82_02670, partial [Alphaproteobacteria bacterium]|nr:hypothetical protein [Alphaproteobacteria bacterium]
GDEGDGAEGGEAVSEEEFSEGFHGSADLPAPVKSPVEQPSALVGVKLRLLRSSLKRTAPTDARGRCPQKLNFVSLIKETDDDHHAGSIGGRPLALVGIAFRLLRCRLKRTAPADARRRCLQKKI